MNPEFEFNWHHDLLIKKLEAVERGEIKRLMISMPPRMGKSYLCSKWFPTWYMGRNPTKEIIQASYSQDFVLDIGRFVKNVIKDNSKFKHVFPFVNVATDSKASDKFSIQGTEGNYFAVGVGGPTTGRGANCLAQGTLVNTEHGLLPIEELHNYIGHKVWSYNAYRDVTELKEILAFRKGKATNLYKLEALHGSGSQILYATAEHLIYTLPNEYKQMQDLRKGDVVLRADKEVMIVISIDPHPTYDSSVYDIQVQDNNNFFANGILVHNCIIIDDPLKNAEDANSPVIREKLWDWYQSTLYTRLMPGASLIYIGTRWHSDDLAGRILVNDPHGKWDVVNLPAVDEEGKALWPTRYNEDALEDIKQTIGPRQWAALYMQTPILSEGAIIQESWFKYYTALPPLIKTFWSVDTASKEGQENDYSVAQLWGQAHNGYYLIKQIRGRWRYTVLRAKLEALFTEFPADECLVEDTSAGTQIIQEFKEYATFPIIAMKPGKNMPKDKVERVEFAATHFQAGNIYFPEKEDWVHDLKAELIGFPYWKNDDQADCLTQIIFRMTRRQKKRIFDSNIVPISVGESLKYMK